MRHAKSSWADDSILDRDRPLNERGLRDAPRMAQFLVANKLTPDLIVSSSANRARSTAILVADDLDSESVTVEFVDDFYLATPDIYLEFACRLSDQFNRPLFVGHNPGMETLVNDFGTNEWENMPTAAIAHVKFDFENWNELESQPTGRSVAVYRPKSLVDF